MKKLFTIFCLTILLSGCFNQTENKATEKPKEKNTSIVNVAETGEQNIYEINMTAKKFDFDPHTIIVNKGEKVILNITSIDVNHGISIPDFNVSADLPANETVKVEFTADKIGEFEFKCSVFCGSGHRSMSGKIIIEE